MKTRPILSDAKPAVPRDARGRKRPPAWVSHPLDHLDVKRLKLCLIAKKILGKYPGKKSGIQSRRPTKRLSMFKKLERIDQQVLGEEAE